MFLLSLSGTADIVPEMSRSDVWTQLLSFKRLGAKRPPAPPSEDGAIAARTDFQRDFDRIVFSTAFRRLHDKTQVFPLPENDLVHSRLTHSLEVSCVGRTLGTMAGKEICARSQELLGRGLDPRAFGDIVAAACLAHDLGNPPFGHAGEDAIGTWFREHASLTDQISPGERLDLEYFEGNAQGFRIVTRLQMPENPGLQLSVATLAAFTKYPRSSGPPPGRRNVAWKKHGVNRAELGALETVLAEVGLPGPTQSKAQNEELLVWFWPRHPLAFLVEAADDICYSILDIEDGFRLGHAPFEEVESLLHEVASADPSYQRRAPVSRTDQKEAIAYLRAKSINRLAAEVTQAFLDNEEALLSGTVTAPLSESVPSAPALRAIVAYTVDTCYRARDVVEIELAGYEVLSALLDEFVPAAIVEHPSKRQRRLRDLLPDNGGPPLADLSRYERLLRVTDHLSGMTDRYAVATYRKLHGISLSRGYYPS